MKATGTWERWQHSPLPQVLLHSQKNTEMEQTGSNMSYKLYPIQANILWEREKFLLKTALIGQECKKTGFGDSNTQDEENV